MRLIAILCWAALGGHGAAAAHEIHPLVQRSQTGEDFLLPVVTADEHLFLPDSLDLGSQAVGTSQTRQVLVSNQTRRGLHVTAIAPPGLHISEDEFDLEPLGEVSLDLTWTPPQSGDLVGDLVFTISHQGMPTFAIEKLRVRGTATTPGALASTTWLDFETASDDGTEPLLPDFSYAGYRYSNVPIPDVGGPLFDVTDPAYGAVAGDGITDRDAIQAAIDAAGAAGGGVVLFPPGVFHLNTVDDPGEPIRIEHSNIVLRGAGAEGAPVGTTLTMEHHYPLNAACQLYSAPFMVQAGLPAGAPSPVELATVVADARRETFSVTVDDAAALSVGQWITLFFISNRDEVVDYYLAPKQRPACDPATPPALCWGARGVQVRERHRIAAIDERRVTFEDPIHIDVELDVLGAGEAWKLLSYPHLEEVGIEDLLFQGGWTQSFRHHRTIGDCSSEPNSCGEVRCCQTDACVSHDSAWSAVLVDSVVDGWVRRVRFRDWNQSLFLSNSSACSVLGVDFEGNRGHFSVSTSYGTGNLIGVSRDLAGYWHGPSIGYSSAATVFWRFSYPGTTSFDSHSTSPYATLHDLTAGGLRLGRSGGPLHGMPHHLRHLVLWNFERRGLILGYDFWTAPTVTPPTHFVLPILVGFHGVGGIFQEEDLEVDELHGAVVSPPSLFEAQLARRLGELPAWLAGLRDSPR